MGVKKSTVCTSARSLVRRYTPASSALAEPTSTFGSRKFGSCRKTCDRAFWLNFDAHPAQDESDVSLRICSREDRKSTRLNSSHVKISYAVFCLKKKKGNVRHASSGSFRRAVTASISTIKRGSRSLSFRCPTSS